MKQNLLSNQKLQLQWLLPLLWCLMQLFLFSKFGIKVVHDSHRYLNEAAGFLANPGNYPFKKSYVSYTLILAAFLKTTNATAGVVLLQTAVSGLATIAFYNATFYLWSSRFYASLATLLLVLWPDFQLWNFYIHTESLFVSGIIFVFYRLLTLKTWRHGWQLVVLLLFVLLLRPNGFMVALAAAGYLAAKYYLHKGFRLLPAAVGCIAIGVPLLVLLANYFLKDISSNHSFSGHLASGNIIQGNDAFELHSSKNLMLQGSTVNQLLQLATGDPIFFFAKSGLRFMLYWAQVRPHYANWHNLLIVLFLYPAYLGAAVAVWKKQVPAPVLVFVFMLAAQLSAMVMVSGVDWDNRFMMPLLPFTFLLAVAGIRSFTRATPRLT